MKQQQTPWLQQKLEAIWYERGSTTLNHLGKWLLLPLSTLFSLVSHIKRKRDEAKQADFDIPIIVVGNINVGGTGKTPLVIKLTELLKTNHYRPCIITRGYKGTATEWPVAVNSTTPVALAGDEAKLMAIRSNIPVIAGADRVADIRYVLKNTDCNVIISDDGLQHYKMKRDIEIAVIDGQRRFGNGHCLPAGPLREQPQRLEECDFLITNGKPTSDKDSGVNKMRNLAPNFCSRLDDLSRRIVVLCNDLRSSKLGQKGKLSFVNYLLLSPKESLMQITGSVLINVSNQQKKPLSAFESVQVYTGIGNPQRFINTLQSNGLTISHQVIFPDHYHFTADDFDNPHSGQPIIMTEKDAVKCAELGLENSWYLPINAQLEKAFEVAFLEKVSRISPSSS